MESSAGLKDFRFGLETEYIVLDRRTNQALWHPDLNFANINALFEDISLERIPSLDGLELEKPHRRLMPYVVEGYHLPDQDFQAKDLLPKGIEIRTPVCESIGQCLEVQATLIDRLATRLSKENLGLLALSHHPKAHHFRGPQNKRRHDFWQWAMEVMTTYGPDINVGLPQDLWDRVSRDEFQDLHGKINYYSTAMTALSVRAPFRDGELWRVRGSVGKSLRVYRRSVIAPPIEIHPHENRRLEFKVFDMTTSLAEMEGYFLLFMTLLLSENLFGRASNATRIYDCGEVAREGLTAEGVDERLGALLDEAELVLPRWGFSARGLSALIERYDSRRCPADELIERYEQVEGHLPTLLGQLADETVSPRVPA